MGQDTQEEDGQSASEKNSRRHVIWLSCASLLQHIEICEVAVTQLRERFRTQVVLRALPFNDRIQQPRAKIAHCAYRSGLRRIVIHFGTNAAADAQFVEWHRLGSANRTHEPAPPHNAFSNAG